MDILKRLWAYISNLGVSEDLLSGEAKRTRLTNRIGLWGAILSMPHIFHFIELGQSAAAICQISTVIGLFSILLWNSLGFRSFSKYWVIILASISVFFTSSFLGFESGEHLAYIAIILLIFTLFDLQDKISLIILVAFSISCIVILEYFDYGLLGEALTSPEERRTTYTGNFFATITISIAIALYFQSLSDRQVEEIVDGAQRELKSVFNNSFDAIFIADLTNHNIIEGNRRSLELFDAESIEKLIGLSIPQLLKNSYRPDELQSINYRLTHNEKWSNENEFVSLKGREFWGNMAYTLIRYGEEQQLLLRVTDITENKEAEKKLIIAKERAESAMIAKAHFLNNMSHEIRTPINGVIGLAEIISTEYGTQEEDLNMYADLLLESGQRLLRTISSILDLSNLETYETELTNTQVCLNQILESTTREYLQEALEKGIELKILPMKSIYYVESDLSLLQKVMEHLIGNAVKFTDTGKVEIWIDVHNDPASPKPFWDIIVKDTGIGMSKEFIDKKLFMKFEQESEGLDRNYEGSGLGLSLVKRIITLLKGEIFVESTQGIGSKFTVRLPGFSASRIKQ